jgi:hypothetical protein
MATKEAAAIPVDAPSMLFTKDGNKLIARTKVRLAKNWSLTRMATLFEISQLAWFLVALERSEEAGSLVDRVADGVTFTGNHNIWSPASNSISLAARLARQAGDEARRAALIAKLVEHPAVASMPRAGLLDWVAKADQDLRTAQVATSQKWAREGFARACARATYFRETATEGAYEADVIDVEALDRTIAEALAGLRPHLGV